MPKKLSLNQCRDILADESKAVAYYDKLGFHRQAQDELRHYNFFKKKCHK